ncbi:MAG: di-heme oxidoredictase family protein [Verrucomicrobiales bacterium]
MKTSTIIASLAFDYSMCILYFCKVTPSVLSIGLLLILTFNISSAQTADSIGREVSIAHHLSDGDEHLIPLRALLEHGRRLFVANWTSQEGGGRPLTKGTGAPLADPAEALTFPRNFNRISAPDANSCAGCHNSPIAGGNGDIVANVFVTGQRFDFVDFNGDGMATKNHTDESGKLATLAEIGNSRATLGMMGSGYIEMLARQMTSELRTIRDQIEPGESALLVAKGVSFGTLGRTVDGSWDVSQVEGLVAPSLAVGDDGPGLEIRPFHQAGNVISLRQFTNNAMNHHHGIQTTERFGDDTDPDGDSFVAEMTRADTTACSIFQATMAVPGRVIPNNPQIESAVLVGEQRFMAWGCASCHTPALPLTGAGNIFIEPNPFNPVGNLLPGEAPDFAVDLNDGEQLPLPRLSRDAEGITWVPAFTDLKVHDITSGVDDPNREMIDMNEQGGSAGFFAGNSRFLTRKLWGAYGKPNFFHHGKFTTMRQAVLAHAGEAAESRAKFLAAAPAEQDFLIEFLKTLQNLPSSVESTVVDENFESKIWPPLKILGLTTDGDSIEITWQGVTGVYPFSRLSQIEISEDLTNWEPAGEPTLFNIGNVGIAGPQTFFRIRLVEP